MPLKRNTAQRSQTLIEFYNEFRNSNNTFSQKAGSQMIQWIERINNELTEIEIWGLTSHAHLILQNKDDFTSENYIVLKTGMDEFHIEYLLPKDLEPWQNAYVKGATKSLDEAMKMLKKAIVNSKGWNEFKTKIK